MNKGQLQEQLIKVAEKEGITLSRRGAGIVLSTLFDPAEGIIARAVKKGDKVSLPGFGTFTLKKRARRTARNPQTGATVKVPASKTVGFKAGAGLKATLNGRR